MKPLLLDPIRPCFTAARRKASGKAGDCGVKQTSSFCELRFRTTARRKIGASSDACGCRLQITHPLWPCYSSLALRIPGERSNVVASGAHRNSLLPKAMKVVSWVVK